MRTLIFVLAVATAAPACTLDDPSTGETTQRVELKNRLSSNRLSSNRLSSNRLSSNRLSSNALDSTKLVALQETAGILESVSGRDVYSYIISCALPADKSIVADLNYLPVVAAPGPNDPSRPPDTNCTDPGPNGVNCPNYTCVGGVCTFYGNANLAPGWISKKLGNADAGWVSACMFARVNANDVAEAISLRGRNDALAVSPEEAAEFTYEEGAFYGNLFINDPDPTHPPDWNACRGADKAATPTLGGLANRECAEENPNNLGFTYCGFKYNGDCRDFDTTTPSPHACASFDGTYNDCHDSQSSDRGHWHKSSNYRQVITTYISNL